MGACKTRWEGADRRVRGTLRWVARPGKKGKGQEMLGQCQNQVRSEGYIARLFFVNSCCWPKAPGTDWDGINKGGGGVVLIFKLKLKQ